MGELKGKMNGLIEKISLQAQARILKVSKIKEKYEEKLVSFTLQEPVRLDFSLYASYDAARKDIFSKIFTIEKQQAVSSFASLSASISASVSISTSVMFKANVNLNLFHLIFCNSINRSNSSV